MGIKMKTAAVYTVLVDPRVLVCNKFKRLFLSSANVLVFYIFLQHSLSNSMYLQGSFTYDVGKGGGVKSKIVFLVITTSGVTTSVTGFTVGSPSEETCIRGKISPTVREPVTLSYRNMNIDSILFFFLCLKLNIIKK